MTDTDRPPKEIFKKPIVIEKEKIRIVSRSSQVKSRERQVEESWVREKPLQSYRAGTLKLLESLRKKRALLKQERIRLKLQRRESRSELRRLRILGREDQELARKEANIRNRIAAIPGEYKSLGERIKIINRCLKTPPPIWFKRNY